MDLSKKLWKVLYGVTSVAAVFSALVSALVFLAGFFYAGLAGDTPDDTGYHRYSMFALAGIVATVFVVVGFFGSTSNKKIFSISTMLGTGALLAILVPFNVKAVDGYFQVWVFAIIFCQFAALLFSGLRLKQLCSTR